MRPSEGPAARVAASAPPHVTVLVTPAPYRAFVAVAQKLYPGALRPSSLFEASGGSVQFMNAESS